MTDTDCRTKNRNEYNKRLRAALDRLEPHCEAKGPYHAECVLPPFHGGNWHEGNGYDEWGSRYEMWRGKSLSG